MIVQTIKKTINNTDSLKNIFYNEPYSDDNPFASDMYCLYQKEVICELLDRKIEYYIESLIHTSIIYLRGKKNNVS
jgi:hypothetical protein